MWEAKENEENGKECEIESRRPWRPWVCGVGGVVVVVDVSIDSKDHKGTKRHAIAIPLPLSLLTSTAVWL